MRCFSIPATHAAPRSADQSRCPRQPTLENFAGAGVSATSWHASSVALPPAGGEFLWPRTTGSPELQSQHCRHRANRKAVDHARPSRSPAAEASGTPMHSTPALRLRVVCDASVTGVTQRLPCHAQRLPYGDKRRCDRHVARDARPLCSARELARIAQRSERDPSKASPSRLVDHCKLDFMSDWVSWSWKKSWGRGRHGGRQVDDDWIDAGSSAWN